MSGPANSGRGAPQPGSLLPADRNWLRPYAKSNDVTADTCGHREAGVRFDLLGLEEPVRREVLAVAVSRRFARGVVVFHEGEAGGSLHVLMRGRASVWVTTPSGDTVTLNVIGPGTAFGELSLLLPATERTATVQAIAPVQTLVLSRAEFQRLRRSYPSVDRLLVDYLASQVRRLSARQAEVLFPVPVPRVLQP